MPAKLVTFRRPRAARRRGRQPKTGAAGGGSIAASTIIRLGRIAGFFVAAFTLLFVVLASGMSPETEVTWAVPFGMLPIALLLAIGAAGLELGNAPPVSRRDGLFGLSAAVAAFAILRLAKLL